MRRSSKPSCSPLANIDDEILRGAEEDAKEVAFIKNYMGVENRELFTDEDIY